MQGQGLPARVGDDVSASRCSANFVVFIIAKNPAVWFSCSGIL